MRKLFITLAVGLLAVAGFAYAQVTLPQVTTVNLTDLFQILPLGSSSFGNKYISLPNLRVAILGGNLSHAGTPVLTSCITGSGTIVGNDNAFVLTGGSTASTSCVATFAQAFATRPTCSVTSETAYATTTPSYAVSTTAVTITQASNSSEVYDVICVAKAGG